MNHIHRHWVRAITNIYALSWCGNNDGKQHETNTPITNHAVSIDGHINYHILNLPPNFRQLRYHAVD